MPDSQLNQLTKTNVHTYLTQLYNQPITVQKIYKLGENPEDSGELKGFGYGFPYVIEFTKNKQPTKIVLETMRPGGNGHDHFSDRAQILLWQHSAFNKLPKHVHSIDVGAFENTGKLVSVGKCNEFFIVAEFIQGNLYHQDLDRIKETDQTTPQDTARCQTLSNYLVKIHQTKKNQPELYIRRIRDLIGHGECIMGLTDSYPKQFEPANQTYLTEIEKDCITWRWKLKEKTHRLSQVHGDYHPWNLLFREGTDFTALDRSRGEWGEPADDIAALTINYIFYSLQKHCKLTEPFESLFKLFWENYLKKTQDTEVLGVIQPFYAWRGLVVASPVWYPNLDMNVRKKLLNFVKNVLQQDRFDITDVNSYFNAV